jgi:flagellar biosynthesis protein FlhG
MGAVDRARLHYRLTSLYDRFDAVVVDSGPGIDGAARVAAARATRLLAVTTPEPASLTDTYALIKIMHAHAPGLPIEVVANRVTSVAEGDETFARLRLAARKFLRHELSGPTLVPDDPAIRDATRRAGALSALMVNALDELAARLDRADPSPEAPCPR